jgi:hypothetical protein
MEQGFREIFGHKDSPHLRPKVRASGSNETEARADEGRLTFRAIRVRRPPWGVRLLKGPELQFEGPFRLNRETDRDVGGTVEFLEHLVAKQATILTLDAGPGSQLDAAIAGMTGRTGKV